ncbi:hypothetical protein [Variovorax sp. UC74_104]|uniref:hypothetical protein n=1 Tax=Variovorax sp. UC74_104 TaxID=3374555 RepID=UPI0037567E0F
MRASKAWSPPGSRRTPDTPDTVASAIAPSRPGSDAAAMRASALSSTSVRACDATRCTSPGNAAQPASSEIAAMAAAHSARASTGWCSARMHNRHARGSHAARSMAKGFGVFMAVLGASEAASLPRGARRNN